MPDRLLLGTHTRLVFAATSYDVASYGFEDLQLYRELSYTADKRFLQEDAADDPLHQEAADVLRAWADPLPADVEAKYCDGPAPQPSHY